MVIGVSAAQYRWRDMEEAVARGVDEFGLDLVEFDADRLREEQYPELGILSQQYGALIGLHARLDVSLLSREAIVAWLQMFQDRCQEAMSTYLAVDLVGAYSRGALANSVRGLVAARAFEREGIRFCFHLALTPSPAARVRRARSVRTWKEDVSPEPPSLVWYEQREEPGTRRPIWRLGCVHLFGDDWVACLPEIREMGFRGPYVLDFPEGGDLGYREAAERIWATVAP